MQCIQIKPQVVSVYECYNTLLSSQLIVVDVNTNALFTIPLLRNSFSPKNTDAAGIHCIEISEDRSFLCTGAKNPNELAVYKLPEMVPHSIGQVRFKITLLRLLIIV